MNIFNKLHISYKAKSILENGKFRTYNIFIDGETILIENSNFSEITLNEQFLIVKKFIKKDSLKYKNKECINIRWKEIESVEKALQNSF